MVGRNSVVRVGVSKAAHFDVISLSSVSRAPRHESIIVNNAISY
jgi:hypothetical protein